MGRHGIASLTALLVSLPIYGQAATWQSPGSGDWNTALNWNSGVPNGIGAIAIFDESAPRQSSTIVFSVPITLGAIESYNPFALRLAGPHTISLRAEDDPASIFLGNLSGGLRIDSPIELFSDVRVFVSESAQTLSLNGSIVSAGRLTKTGGGGLALQGDNRDWSGELIIEDGTAETHHPWALGDVAARTRLNGGTLVINAATQEPVMIQNGTLIARAPFGPVTLAGGALRLDADLPVPLFESGSTSGEIQIGRDNSFDFVLTGGSPGPNGDRIVLLGQGNTPFFDRLVSGTITFQPSATQPNLLLGGRGVELQIKSNLLAANGVTHVETVEGTVELDGNNTYTGQTIVGEGTVLRAFNRFALGTTGNNEAEATLVKSGGTLEFTTLTRELVILDGGRLKGRITGDVIVRSDSLISTGQYDGTISGPGGVTYVVDRDFNGTIELNSANSYLGRTIIASATERAIDVNHVGAFGSGSEPVLILGGELNLRVLPSQSFIVEGGELRPMMERFDGNVVLRGGSLVSNGPSSVTITQPIVVEGRGSSIRGGNTQFPLVINNRITGPGDLRVGLGVIFNDVVEIGGDLRITNFGVEFNAAPNIGGALVLDQSGGSFSAGATFHTNAAARLRFRGGYLNADADVKVTSLDPVVDLQRGGIDAALDGAQTIIKTEPYEARLFHIGESDAEIIIHEGTLSIMRGSGMGSPAKGVKIASPTDAVLRLEGFDNIYADAIELNNASGINGRGALVLGEGSGTQVGTITGPIHLGDRGAVIGMRGASFSLRNEIRGGDLNLVGDGTFRIFGNAAAYTGKTRIGFDEYGAPVFSLVENARLAATSAIEIGHRGVFEIDKRNSRNLTDAAADHIPITMYGGTIRLVGADFVTSLPEENIGAVTLQQGASEVVLNNTVIADNPGVLKLASLNRAPGATIVFHNDSHGRLGGDAIFDPRILIGETPPVSNGMIAAWAIVKDGQRADFASYESLNGMFALPTTGRPTELNGANQNSHVRLTAPPVPMAADTDVASVVTDDGSFGAMEVDLGGKRLNIVSGGLLASRTAFDIRNGSLTAAGVGPGSELIAHIEGNESKIQANIVDSPSGPVSLVKSGTGTLRLSGNNSYSGTTTINEGLLQIDQASALPVTTTLIIQGGRLVVELNNPVRVHQVVVRQGMLSGGAVSKFNADSFVIEAGGLSSIEGNARVTKIGPERASLGDTPEFTGPIEIQEGRLMMAGFRMGSGPILIQEKGVFELPEGRVPRTVTLNGGTLESTGGTPFRPSEIQRPVLVDRDSTINVSTEFSMLQLSAGARLSDGVTLVKKGPGFLRIADQLVIAPNVALEIEHGHVELTGNLLTPVAGLQLSIRGSNAELHSPEIGLSIASDNQGFAGDIQITDLTVSINNTFALGDGQTTVGKGGRLVLNVPEVAGNVILDGGELITTSQSTFDGTLVNGGDLSPGASPGTLIVNGDYVQDNAGRLVMEIADPLLAGSLYPQTTDKLEVAGELRLNGTLEVRLLHDFMPEIGATFQLFDSNVIDGKFSSIELPAITSGRAWSLSRLYSRGELYVISDIVGDSNRDGAFNSSDLVVVFQAGQYESGVAAKWETGDWNRDGFFNSTDLVHAFQAGTYLANAETAVPEPMPLPTTWLGLLGVFCFRLSKQRMISVKSP